MSTDTPKGGSDSLQLSADVEEVTAALLNATISSVDESVESSGTLAPADSDASSSVPAVTTSSEVGLGGVVVTTSSVVNASESIHSGSSTCGRSGAVTGTQPVAKADLPFNQQTFCPRPAKTIEDSALGKKIVVDSNFYKINMSQTLSLFSYDLQYSHATKMKKGIIKREETKRLFWAMVKQHPSVFPSNIDMVFNDVNMLWTLRPLKTRNRGDFTLPVQMGDGRFVDEFSVRICYTSMVSIEMEPRDKKERAALQCFLDALFTMRIRSTPCDDSRYFVSHGSSMFYAPTDRAGLDPRLVVQLGQGLEAWTGLHGAVKPDCQNGLLYNVDISHSVFYKQDYCLVRFYCEVIMKVPFAEREMRVHEDELKRLGMERRSRDMLAAALKGTSVTARYANFERTLKFGSIGQKAATAHVFEFDGHRMTVAEYFLKKYNLPLGFPGLPCVQMGKKNNWVPMEFVFTWREPTKFRGKIPEAQLGRLVRETAFHPLQRKKILEKMAASNQEDQNEPVHLSAQDEYMRNFGVSIDRSFQRVKATILPVPTLQFGNSESFTDKDHHGVWRLTNQTEKGMKQVIAPQAKKIISAIIFIESNHPVNVDVRPFGFLMRVLHSFGIAIPGGEKAFLASKFSQERDGWEKMLSWMRELKQKVNEFDKDAIPMCMFVFPYRCTTRRQKRDDAYFSEYAMVKYICDVVVGIHCQCIVRDVYDKMNGNPMTCSTAHNVSLKIMGKIGATHYTLERDGMHKNWTRLTNPAEPTLILGVDVTHPGEMDRNQGDHAKLSVACVVGNIDIECVQYRSSVRVQREGEERLVCMKDEVYSRITAFQERNGVKPEHILVYRDGVSETEFQTTLYEEKNSLEMACMHLHPDYKPTITYIVVSKRHHTRFFPVKEEDTEGRAYNLKPGTLVETGVTTKSYFDFYLISQFGPLGTSRPTHYYVLWDDWNPSHTFWQTITHALTYTYVRCPKSISQPAPVMYAHLAAKRAKEYLMAYHYAHYDSIRKMTPYEQFVRVTENLQQSKDLNGMVFV